MIIPAGKSEYTNTFDCYCTIKNLIFEDHTPAFKLFALHLYKVKFLIGQLNGFLTQKHI